MYNAYFPLSMLSTRQKRPRVACHVSRVLTMPEVYAPRMYSPPAASDAALVRLDVSVSTVSIVLIGIVT